MRHVFHPRERITTISCVRTWEFPSPGVKRKSKNDTMKFWGMVCQYIKNRCRLFLAASVHTLTEDLFSRLKAVLARNGMKQKDFLIGLIEDAIEKEEAKWKAESEEAEETEMEDPETAKSEPDEESVEPEAEEPETEALEAETDGEMTEPDEAEADEEPTEPENEEPAEAEPTELETEEAEESEPEEAES